MAAARMIHRFMFSAVTTRAVSLGLELNTLIRTSLNVEHVALRDPFAVAPSAPAYVTRVTIVSSNAHRPLHTVIAGKSVNAKLWLQVIVIEFILINFMLLTIHFYF
jgi:hypothetical protein